MKDTVKKMRRQATHWEKIFAKQIFDTRLVSNIYKEHSKLNNKKINLFKKTSRTSEQAPQQRNDTDGK